MLGEFFRVVFLAALSYRPGSQKNGQDQAWRRGNISAKTDLTGWRW